MSSAGRPFVEPNAPAASERTRFAPWLLAGLLLVLVALLSLPIFAKLLGIFTIPHSRGIGHNDISFEVSPAGDMIVFNAAGEGRLDLYVLRLDDLSVSLVAATPEYETNPAFTPDGRSVVYSAGVPGDRADHIFLRPLDRTGPRQLTQADANDSSPQVSPDGSLVVFGRAKTYHWGGLGGNGFGGGVICVVGIDGKNERQLTPDETFACTPWFLPDGKSVAYWAGGDIYAIPMDGSSSSRLLADLRRSHEVAPSHDGGFAYTRGQYSGSQELLFANADGTDERRIAPKLGGYFRPRFSPADDCLFFLKEEWPDGPTGTPKFSLWRIDLDGSNLRRVASSRLFDQPFECKPDATSD